MWLEISKFKVGYAFNKQDFTSLKLDVKNTIT